MYQRIPFSTPDLTEFTGAHELGLTITGMHLQPDQAILECRTKDPDPWCTSCGAEGRSLGSITRRLAHVPFGHRPTTVLLRIRRYTCTGCARYWAEDTTAVAEPKAKLTRSALRWALTGLVVDHLSVARVAAKLGVSWHTANSAVLDEGHRVLINDSTRFAGVTTIGVDEHVWRHVRGRQKYVTVIIDLTPVRTKTGPARLLDMIEGRSKAMFKTWLEARDTSWRQGVEVVAMDGFSGFKTATSEELPDAAAVMDPFHVVKLAGEALDDTRRRTQTAVHGRRGRRDDPLYKARRTLLTRHRLLTEKQRVRLAEVFDKDEHAAVEVTWDAYQEVIGAYDEKDRRKGKKLMAGLIESLRAGVPAGLEELKKLGRTLNRRKEDVLAFFDHPGSSNGPTEAINGRLEHLRGTALGFRRLENYIARSL
ncbi:ISL3 family transposase, partial [Brevibacterium samyangense]|uniref:ISL3 family transposase n=1 Tax=Brevibacterium samyangense TaxID=366888 RepID=UPI0031D82F50